MIKPVLVAETREKIGKKELKSLREDGYVPGIIYGNKKDNKNVKFKNNEIEKLLNNYKVGSRIEIKLDNNTYMAIIKDIQYHTTKMNVLHVDFQELTKGEKIKVRIPINIVNKSLVENSSCVVQEQLHEIELQTVPKYLPESIEVDVCGLKPGESVKVGDLDICKNENIEVLTDSEQIIALLAGASKEEAAVTKEENLTDLY